MKDYRNFSPGKNYQRRAALVAAQRTKKQSLPDPITMTSIPLVQYIEITAPHPGLHDNTADIDRLKKSVAQSLAGTDRQPEPAIRIPHGKLSAIADAFRRNGFQGCAVVNRWPDFTQIIDFLPATPAILPAMALDLGTTHLEATLIDLRTGQTLGRSHGENRQIEYGADILSRIHFACQSKGKGSQDETPPGLTRLKQAVLDSIDFLAADLARQAGITPGEIRAMSISGNTTMIHLLLGVSPHHICREPYIPLVNAPDPARAAEIGPDIHPDAPVWILPSIGSYFGGDLISGILASDLDRAAGTSMLIDVGTNAEVVLGNKDWLIACAGAAGPALEGGVARMGMRAGPGAIERVRIDRDTWQLEYKTIDNEPARGICGSGMIDLAAELYLARVIDLRGKFIAAPASAPARQKKFIRERVIDVNGETMFVVAPSCEAADKRPVGLSQIDLDAMMRSKAAMYAILTTLIAQVGIEFSELENIYVAGAFGKHINPRQATILGMLPDLPLTVYQPLGNSSLSGAELILLDAAARQRAAQLGNKITYIELNVNQEFMIRFSGSRFIPHTDPKLFPSVPVFDYD